MKFSKGKIKSFIEIVLIIAIFIFFSYLVQSNLDFIEQIMRGDILGIVIYILVGILAMVFAPISTLPLLPIASNMWGWFFAGILTWISWIIGSIFSFILARTYGVLMIGKIIPLNKMARFEKMIPKKALFLDVLFLRMIIPADILSYFLGLFTNIDFKKYLLATLIGLIPVVFLLTYVGNLPFYYQIVLFLVVCIAIVTGGIIRVIKH